MENKDYANQLLQRYLNDTASPDEIRALLAALESGRDQEEWEALLMPLFNEKAQLTYRPEEWENVLEHILHHKEEQEVLESGSPARTVRLFPFPRMVAAAVVLLVIATGALLWQNLRSDNNKPSPIAKQDVAPASDRAVLTLADGSTVLLDSTANGLLAQQGGMKITKSANGQVIYRPVDSDKPATVLAFNTLSTPRGGKYRVTLPDGSQVWLNAATTLRYPVRFTGNERKVELAGEAYFEITSNAAAPFKVVSAGQEVTVLGTQFNVNAYTDETDTKTTLLTGKVSVTNRRGQGQRSAMLLPGQQARVKGNETEVANGVDLQQVMAWKNGQLAMQNLDLKAVMRQISRWYDVDVVYEGPLPAGRFGGILDQKLYLSNIMEVLEDRGVHCRLEGQRLYISSK